MIGAALTARCLVPTELPEQGTTLWLAQLWLAAGVIWAWKCWQQGGFRVGLNPCDFAVWGVGAGHVLSAVSVLLSEGQKRSALNMLWEWVGLGIAWLVVRQTIRTRADARQVASLLMIMAIVLAGAGFWQTHVSVPRAAATYDSLRRELDEAENPHSGVDSAEPPTPEQRRQHVKILERQLLATGVPPGALAGPTRVMFEKRLRSIEPSGSFSLTNTFAGWLLVWLLPVLAAARGEFLQSGFAIRALVISFGAGVIACALMETKCRTAWAGLAVALLLWTVWNVRVPGRSRWALAVAALFGIGGLSGLLIFEALRGVLDAEVLTEAPKSLRYRLQYWSAAWDVVRDHPLLGVGPGAFQQHYLKYKRPESSEEIADPHNFVLDLWANGGSLAVLCMAIFVVLVGRRALQQGSILQPTEVPDSDDNGTMAGPLVLGAAMGFWLVVGYSVLSGQPLTDLQIPVMFAVWLVAHFIFRRTLATAQIPEVCFSVAFVALLVHLLGAGGIEMPAIVQTLLLLPVLTGMTGPAGATVNPFRKGACWAAGVAGLILTLFAACMLTSTVPVLRCQCLIDAGNAAWVGRGDRQQATASFMKAARCDPLSPDPLRRRAEVAFDHWSDSADATDHDFEECVRYMALATKKDPVSPVGYRMLGQFYMQKYWRAGNVAAAAAAARAFAIAVNRYPHYAPLRAELAGALFCARDFKRAHREAEEALALDSINHREGHEDKYLDHTTATALQEMKKGNIQ